MGRAGEACDQLIDDLYSWRLTSAGILRWRCAEADVAERLDEVCDQLDVVCRDARHLARVLVGDRR